MDDINDCIIVNERKCEIWIDKGKNQQDDMKLTDESKPEPLSPECLNENRIIDSNVYLLVDELTGIDLNQETQLDQFDKQTKDFQSPQKTITKTSQSYHRSSRSVRGLKRPQPQPHVCVLDKTTDGRNVYINVLSWIKVIKPKHPLDPIPLFGGIRVRNKIFLHI